MYSVPEASRRCQSLTSLVLLATCLTACTHSLTATPYKIMPADRPTRIAFNTGASVSLMPGETLPLRPYYDTTYNTPVSGPSAQVIGYANPPCWSCRMVNSNPAVARLRYMPNPECYLPPDFSGDTPKPCGRNPSDTFIEGIAPGTTTVTATVEEKGNTLKASTQVLVRNAPMRLAFVAPRWGDKLRQGDKNRIAWRCDECAPSDHMSLEIYSGDTSSSAGTIAYHLPTNGAFVWNAKTVCVKDSTSPSVGCHDLPPGYYSLALDMQGGGTKYAYGVAMGPPFQILSQRGARPPDDVTSDGVKGFIVAWDPDKRGFFWLQTAASGKRLVCVSPTTPAYVPGQSSNSTPLTFRANDLPISGTRVYAKGTWEDAHSVDCSGTGIDPEIPPRLRVKDLYLAGSGIFGIKEKCHTTGGGEVCRRIDMLAGANDGSEHNGQYLIVAPPGRYENFSGFDAVEVNPSAWTRFDIKLPE
jgi:hypothetical protein